MSMKRQESVAKAFRLYSFSEFLPFRLYVLASFRYFVKKSSFFFHPLNRNDGLKELESESQKS